MYNFRKEDSIEIPNVIEVESNETEEEMMQRWVYEAANEAMQESKTGFSKKIEDYVHRCKNYSNSGHPIINK